MTVEEYFEEWWPYELPAEGFNKTAMLDYGNTNCKAAQKTTVTDEYKVSLLALN